MMIIHKRYVYIKLYAYLLITIFSILFMMSPTMCTLIDTNNNETYFECTYYVEDIMHYPNITETNMDNNLEHICVDSYTGISYTVHGNLDVMLNGERLVSGFTKLIVPDSASMVKDNGPMLSLNENTYVQNSAIESTINDRRLQSTMGSNTIIIVRVSDKYDTNITPNRSAQQLYDDFFSTDSNTVSLRSVVSGCSKQKLTFEPGGGEEFIHSGIIDLKVENLLGDNGDNNYKKYVESLVTLELVGRGFQSERYDHIVYIMPPGVNFDGSAAYAQVGGRLSVFDNEIGSYPHIQVHEIGHNLGLQHSGDINALEQKQYADPSCSMGNRGVWTFNAPRMCFNAAKSYFLGWYDDRTIVVDPSVASWKGKLVGVSDYVDNKIPSGANEYSVVLRIECVNHPNFYMMFNRKRGVNDQVSGGGNKVIITQEDSSNTNLSWLLHQLDPIDGSNEAEYQFLLDGSNNSLIIKVCSIVMTENSDPDYAEVIIYLEGKTFATCSPTVNPSRAPSSIPSLYPSLVPSPIPSSSPPCAYSESEVILEINNKMWWMLTRSNSGQLVQKADIVNTPETIKAHRWCLECKGNKYRLDIFNFGNLNLEAYYNLQVDGRVIQQNKNFSQEQFEFTLELNESRSLRGSKNIIEVIDHQYSDIEVTKTKSAMLHKRRKRTTSFSTTMFYVMLLIAVSFTYYILNASHTYGLTKESSPSMLPREENPDVIAFQIRLTNDNK
jgi:hypothetical protein